MMSFIPTFEAHAPLNHAIVGAIGTIREYRGKEALYRQQAPQARGAKSEMVRAAISGFSGSFAARELQERCPNVGLDLIRRILGEERKAGRLQVSGRGPDARWHRI